MREESSNGNYAEDFPSLIPTQRVITEEIPKKWALTLFLELTDREVVMWREKMKADLRDRDVEVESVTVERWLFDRATGKAPAEVRYPSSPSLPTNGYLPTHLVEHD